MRFLLLFLSLAVVATTADARPKTYFMFFMRGDGPRPTEKGALEAMQKAHIANMGDQFNKGKIVCAGPLQDPTKERRGIVVLRVENEKEIPSLFTNDPYIQNRIMTVFAHPWDADGKRFNLKLPDPDAIEENRLVVITPTAKPTPREWQAAARRVRAAIPGAVGGQVKAAQPFAVYVFQGNEQTDLEKLFAEDPLVKAGAKLEIIPLWNAKASLPPRTR